jgi:hypothetical protein
MLADKVRERELCAYERLWGGAAKEEGGKNGELGGLKLMSIEHI